MASTEIQHRLARIASGTDENDHSNAMYDQFGFWIPYEDPVYLEHKYRVHPSPNFLTDRKINGK